MKRALVLSGGGTLGAYEMGVWKALRELGITFDVVTGTSIGALIGFFVATDQFDLAMKLWKNVTIDQVLNNAIDLDYHAIQKSVSKDNGRRLKAMIKSYLKNRQLDVSPFYELIDQYIDADLIRKSNMTLGTVSVIWPSLKQIDTVVNQLPKEKVKKYLLASSALFPAFPMVEIDGKKHIDGGYRDNIPIEFALHLGGEEIIVVDVYGGRSFFNNPLSRLPIVKTIGPEWKLGSVLHFDQEVIQRNIALGYNDGLKAYKKRRGYKYTFYNDEKIDEYGRAFVHRLIITNPQYSNRVFALLSRESSMRNDPGDYLLRVLEITAEEFGVDPAPSYHLREFIDVIDNSIVIDEKIVSRYQKTSDFQEKFSVFAPTRKEICQIIVLANQKKVNLDRMIKTHRENIQFVTLAIMSQIVDKIIKEDG
ncbi:MAG: patatin-like phospholipase family protein [Bacilli bacterium]|jgi:NTE family protein